MTEFKFTYLTYEMNVEKISAIKSEIARLEDVLDRLEQETAEYEVFHKDKAA